MRGELLSLIKQFAYARREVTLNSGAKSNFYIDCKRVSMRPDGASALGTLFFDSMRKIESDSNMIFDACGGMVIGAIPISMSLSLHAFSQSRILPTLCVRKEAKDHGTKELIEGPPLPKGTRLLLTEDVVTTGRATIQAAQTFRDAGFEVSQVITIVDRQAGGEENLSAMGLKLHSLFDLSDFGETAS
jgi:orotate phosphoribosyltransferase